MGPSTSPPSPRRLSPSKRKQEDDDNDQPRSSSDSKKPRRSSKDGGINKTKPTSPSSSPSKTKRVSLSPSDVASARSSPSRLRQQLEKESTSSTIPLPPKPISKKQSDQLKTKTRRPSTEATNGSPKKNQQSSSLLESTAQEFAALEAAPPPALDAETGKQLAVMMGLPPPPPAPRGRGASLCRLFLAVLVLLLATTALAWSPYGPMLVGQEQLRSATHAHILLPRHFGTKPAPYVTADAEDRQAAIKVAEAAARGGVTLRQLLQERPYSLGMAPAFFGFYGYFGALAAWQSALGDQVLRPPQIKAVAGASAGAMAAVLLAAGISPQAAAEFCATVTLSEFADFPGLFALFRGHQFEWILFDFLRRYQPQQQKHQARLVLEHALVPVAVTAFDIQSLQGQILLSGSMARAARASATFPFLFQPVYWDSNEDTSKQQQSPKKDYLLIDGGIADVYGMQGIEALLRDKLKADAQDEKEIIINLKVGDFWPGSPPGPSALDVGDRAVVSVSILGLPQCGPWAMEMGPVAVKAARDAMMASLDVPLYPGQDGSSHYELHIDASSFWQPPAPTTSS